MWLDDARGEVTDWFTRRWVQATGRRVTLADCPWLDAVGGARIGADFFQGYARQHGLHADQTTLRPAPPIRIAPAAASVAVSLRGGCRDLPD